MEQQRLVLRVRVESGIPKLLVKINPSEAEGFSAKNLGEVKLRKTIAGAKASAHRGHVAVLHMSYSVPPGELVMSLKLAEILDVHEEESVELTSALVAPPPMAAAGVDRSAVPLAPAGHATGGPDLGGAPGHGADCGREPDPSRHGSSTRVGREPPEGIGAATQDTSWFTKAESKYLRRPSPTDGRYAAPWAASAAPEQPAAPKSGSGRASTGSAPKSGAFDFDWLRGLGLEQDAPGWRNNGRSQNDNSRSQSAFTSSSERRAEQSASHGQPFPRFQDSQLGEPLPRSVPEVVAPEWLRDLRAFAEWDVREASKPSVAADHPGVAGAGRTQSSGSNDVLRGANLHSSATAPSDCVGGGGDPSKGRSRSRSDVTSGTGRFAAGAANLPSSDREAAESWPRWPFSWLDESGKSAATASLPSEAVAGAVAPGRETRQTWPVDAASASTMPGSAQPAEPLLDPAPTSHGGSATPVDSLPASGSSDEGGSRKVPGAPRRGLKAQRAEGSDMANTKAPAPSPADDFGFDSSILGDLSAATVDWRRSLERVAAEPSWREQQHGEARKTVPREEDVHGRHHDSCSGSHSSSVWDAATPQRAGTKESAGCSSHPAASSTVAESLEPSPVQSPRAMSHSSSQPSSRSQPSHASSTPVLQSQDLPPKLKSVRIAQGTLSQASSRASSGHSSPLTSSPRERNEPASSSSPPTSSAASDQAQPSGMPLPMMPHTGRHGKVAENSGRSSRLLTRRKSSALGCIHQDENLVVPDRAPENREPVPGRWRPPSDMTGGGLERSELGNEVTIEVRQWLLGETSGPQCSQVVLDRALTVLANFKLASGCQLEVLGGPLGAIVGGYSDADWLHDEVFRKQPGDAIREAFMLLGFRGRADGDWSSIAAEEVSLAYRRLCLRGHPSRGGAPRGYLKLQVAMELIRAFAGEAGPLESSRTPRAKDRTPSASSSASCGDTTPSSRFGMTRSSSKDNCMPGFVLNDIALVRELQLTASQAEEEAAKIPQEQLEEMNRALDEYILRQMCFKSEIVDEIARLHEDCAYAILGVDSTATDGEIKKAYRLIAMQCHPDKGGDKEDFQELNNAYEKIMEQRRETKDPWRDGRDDPPSDDDIASDPVPKKDKKAQKADTEGDEAADADAAEGEADEEKENDKADDAEEDEYGEEGSNASLVEKAGKAAEEASRYAKTAAEFAHQAAEAAETARRGREQGSRDTLTKSIAHSAIVLTLTVVKAVRVVGYATLDVAAQCRIAAKRNPNAVGCAERAVTAMSLGLEALNAALACAEVTETTASELQAPAPAADGANASSTAAAERFVGAAVRASLAAASASNAAMSAAIAAVEGSRECARAVEAQQAEAQEKKDAERNAQNGGETAGENGDVDDEAEDAESAEPKPQRPPPPTAEEAAAAATRRLVSQRNNNHKVLQRLNAEILTHQQNVRQFLSANRQLIPTVPVESVKKVFGLLKDYAMEARVELERLTNPDESEQPSTHEELLAAIVDLSMLTPFAQDQALAIPVSVKARVLKMSALYDLGLTMQVLEDEIFTPIRAVLPRDAEAQKKIDELFARIQDELGLHMESE